MDADDSASAAAMGGAAGGAAAGGEQPPWRDGLFFLHREALYEAGPSPLLLSWSDARCSQRFYDYGSTQMAGAITADPTKADKWRTEEVDAAVTFAEVLEAVSQPPMLS